ncbi:branched-chain-amino-acid transaminase [Spirochaeta cellobiosiphila]|uniref:branched-chain-amino-acid transaminase n=1 Tax=Spirochaeta cellobiosiphila TaxID=504483 RepID=UPI000412FC99|nr:branched-chain-amino-acid transaminase [Spirochaeta cellobiosiphila]
MGFSLSILPWIYTAKYINQSWKGNFEEKKHFSFEEELQLSSQDKSELLAKRNELGQLPMVSYTSQYGMGCFEGLKAFPQKDGSLKIFRPDENAKRMKSSMEGLHMPGIDEKVFLNAVKGIAKRNQELGFTPEYASVWEKDNFLSGHSIYIRPFTYSEAAIGLGYSEAPWFIVISTPVSSYFGTGSSKAITTDRIRATKRGTGWIKCDANYVIPTLAKKEAEQQGYMEAIFLDSMESKYIEEGSSSNFFILLNDGTLVTPSLGDTILPGITRKSIMTLAVDMGLTVVERQISIEEALDAGKECFVTGTAAGISFLESMTHKGKTKVFNAGKMGELTKELLLTLKGIQYGSKEDKYNWMVSV